MILAADVAPLTAALYRRHPHLASKLAELHHPPDRPCPPPCPTCRDRHRPGRCPCHICQTVHPGACPRKPDPGRVDVPGPGCLVCQLAAAWVEAERHADPGDGYRSPGYDGMPSGKGSHADPVSSALGLTITTERTEEEEAKADARTFHTPRSDADTLASARSHMREVAACLRHALSGVDG